MNNYTLNSMNSAAYSYRDSGMKRKQDKVVRFKSPKANRTQNNINNNNAFDGRDSQFRKDIDNC